MQMDMNNGIHSNGNGHNAQISTDQFSVRETVRKYTRKKWLFVINVILCLMMGAAYLYIKTPLYNIYATLVIKDQKKGEVTNIALKELDFFDEQKIVDNEAEIIRSENIIRSVVNKLHLNIAYFEESKLTKSYPRFYSSPVKLEVLNPVIRDKYALKLVLENEQGGYFSGDKKVPVKWGESFTINGLQGVLMPTAYLRQYTGKTIRIDVVPPAFTTRQLREHMIINQASKNSSVLNITLQFPSGEKGAEILDAIINEYDNANIRDKKRQTDITLAFIEERLGLIAGELNNFESKEEHYKTTRKITALGADAQLFLDKVKENDSKLNEGKIQLEYLTTIENYIRQDQAVLAPPNSTMSDPVLIATVSKLSQLQLEKEQLSKTVGPENPLLIAKQNQIKEVRQSILQNISTQKLVLTTTLSQLSDTRDVIDNQIRTVPVSERSLTQIMREKNIRENIYTYLLQKREEASITHASAFSSMRIIDNAYSSVKPVSPNKMIVLLTALLAGLVLPVVYINARQVLYNKADGRHTIAAGTSVPVIGEISTQKGESSLLFIDMPGIVTEQFRLLRTRLQRITAYETPKTMLVTSAVSGEGKSFISANLASAFALTSQKTILVEMDLRVPHLTPGLPETDGRGIADFLSGNTSDIASLISPTDIPNLDFIPAGQASDLNHDLFTGNKPDQLFAWLSNHYRYIIINTPPSLLISDTLQLERLSDVTLFIVRHHKTNLRYLSYVERLKKKEKVNNLFIIYNGVPVNQLYEKDSIRYAYFKSAKKKKPAALVNN